MAVKEEGEMERKKFISYFVRKQSWEFWIYNINMKKITSSSSLFWLRYSHFFQLCLARASLSLCHSCTDFFSLFLRPGQASIARPRQQSEWQWMWGGRREVWRVGVCGWMSESTMPKYVFKIAVQQQPISLTQIMWIENSENSSKKYEGRATESLRRQKKLKFNTVS